MSDSTVQTRGRAGLTFDAAPLHSLIARQSHFYDGGMNQLSDEVARRLDRSIDSMRRQLHRIMAMERVTLKVADEWAIALGTHPTLVWGRLEYEQSGDQGDES